MKRMQGFAAVAVVAALAGMLVGCGDNRALAPGDDEANDPDFALHCSLQPEGCPDDTDPAPDAPGYYMGTATTPWVCFSPTGYNINDPDWDGMDNGCERRLAEKFRPSMTVAPPSYDCDPTIDPYWAVKYFPNAGNLVRIAYLLAYNRDCGDRSILSGLLQRLFVVISLNGAINNVTRVFDLEFSTDDPGDSHSGDSEWVMVNLKFDGTTKHWYVSSVKFSAHYGTAADGTKEWGTGSIQWPVGSVYGGYPRVWAAAKKHANYVSRSSCNDGRGPLGLAKDNCDSNIPDSYRLYFHYLRNIGSMQANLINQGTCVQSPEPTFYPATECFWKPGDFFNGWLEYPYGHPPTPYYDQLMMEFECRAYVYLTSSSRKCVDFGVNRLP